MAGTIFLQDSEGKLTEMTKEVYDAESDLQQMIAEHPQLIPGEQINGENPRRWLLIQREATVNHGEQNSKSWYLDHLFLDQDGIPTIIEVKRSQSSEIRREIVGQILDYAANFSATWNAEALQSRFESECEKAGTDPEEKLENFLRELRTSEEYWMEVQDNIDQGRLRLIFAADYIPQELRKIAEFLNASMTNIEVYAVEIPQFKSAKEGIRVLVPYLYGQTVKTRETKSKRTRQQRWDKKSFWNALNEMADEETVFTMRALLDWSRIHAEDTKWGSGENPSFWPVVKVDGKDTGLFYVTFDTMGRKGIFDISFRCLEERFGLSYEEVTASLALIEGANFEPKPRKTRQLDLSLLFKDESRRVFLDFYGEILEKTGIKP